MNYPQKEQKTIFFKMNDLKKYENIKAFIKAIQLSKLEKIIDLVCVECQLNKSDLVIRTKVPIITDARRKITYIAKTHQHINSGYIAERLNLHPEWICTLSQKTFDLASVDKEFQAEIESLLHKLNEDQCS